VRLLLDTHALLWWLGEPERLRPEAREAIAAPQALVCVSAASAWEIAIKLALGKLAIPPDARTWLPEALAASRFTPLAVTIEHALGVEQLPSHHTDPFDRLLIAQALAEQLTLVTRDPAFRPYGAPLIDC
jgi:PIN domain nuclease of toxin-antitoxin system